MKKDEFQEREREREMLSTLFNIQKKKRRSMQFDICFSSVPHFLTFLTSGNCTSMRQCHQIVASMTHHPSAMLLLILWLGFIYFTKQNRVLISRQARKLLVCSLCCRAKVKKIQPYQEPDFVPTFLLSPCGSWMSIQSSHHKKITIGFCWFPHPKPPAGSLQPQIFS